MTNKKYKIKIEESPTSVRVSAKTGNWLFGFKEVPFEIFYYPEHQKDEFDSPPPGIQIEFDTILVCNDVHCGITSDRKRSFWYKDGNYSGTSAITGVSMFGGRTLSYVEPWSISQSTLEKYEPIIRRLEERVGRTLIKRISEKDKI